jgi:Flp pilus assembly protein TadG
MQGDASNREKAAGGGVLMRLGRLWRGRDGAMAVEFAFMAPIFLACLMAVFEFGRYFLISSTVQYAVEDIGRSAMAHYTREYWLDKTETETNLTNTVDTQLEADADTRIFGWDPASITVTGTPTVSSDPTVPSTILIVGTTQFEFMIPFVPAPSLTIRRQTVVLMIRFDS